MPTLKLEHPEFVGDYFKQKIEDFCKLYPEINENRLREFCLPIKTGLERVLLENRELRWKLNQKWYEEHGIQKEEVKCIGFN